MYFAVTDSLSPEAVEPRLRGRFGRPYEYVVSTPSTQLLLPPEAPEGALVAADEQTAGRGRLGRRWLAPAGHEPALLAAAAAGGRVRAAARADGRGGARLRRGDRGADRARARAEVPERRARRRPQGGRRPGRGPRGAGRARDRRERQRRRPRSCRRRSTAPPPRCSSRPAASSTARSCSPSCSSGSSAATTPGSAPRAERRGSCCRPGRARTRSARGPCPGAARAPGPAFLTASFRQRPFTATTSVPGSETRSVRRPERDEPKRRRLAVDRHQHASASRSAASRSRATSTDVAAVRQLAAVPGQLLRPGAEVGVEQAWRRPCGRAKHAHLDLRRVEERERGCQPERLSPFGENAGALAVVAASVRSTQKRVELCTCFVPATAVSVSRYQPSGIASGAPGQLLLAGGALADEDRRHRVAERVLDLGGHGRRGREAIGDLGLVAAPVAVRRDDRRRELQLLERERRRRAADRARRRRASAAP